MAARRCSAEDAVRRLASGGVLLLATDTLPGWHCRADDPVAIRRILAAKGRALDKPLLVLAGSLEQARKFTGRLSAAQTAACRQCWPGPYSLILPVGSQVPPEVTCGRTTIAVRVPDLAALRDLILAVGVPLVSTSANRAGETAAGDLASAAREFGALSDGIWGRDQAGPTAPKASAVVDLTVTPFRVLRAGPQPFPPLES